MQRDSVSKLLGNRVGNILFNAPPFCHVCGVGGSLIYTKNPLLWRGFSFLAHIIWLEAFLIVLSQRVQETVLRTSFWGWLKPETKLELSFGGIPPEIDHLS